MAKRRKARGWRTIIRRGEMIPVVARCKGGDIIIRFGRDRDGSHVIDAPPGVDIIAPERRPVSRKA